MVAGTPGVSDAPAEQADQLPPPPVVWARLGPVCVSGSQSAFSFLKYLSPPFISRPVCLRAAGLCVADRGRLTLIWGGGRLTQVLSCQRVALFYKGFSISLCHGRHHLPSICNCGRASPEKAPQRDQLDLLRLWIDEVWI